MVQVAEGHAGLDRAAQIQLDSVEPVDDLRERSRRPFAPVGARDVGSVAMVSGADVDQEHLPVPDSALAVVVKRGSLLVQSNDRRVGELVVRDTRGRDEGVVDTQLGGARLESFLGRDVPTRGGGGGLLQATELVVGLVAAAPIEPRRQAPRVALEPGGLGSSRLIADERGVRDRTEGGPHRVDARGFDDVEAVPPEGIAERGLLVPIVLGNVANQAGLAPRGEVQEVVRPVHGAPVIEVRRRKERRVVVVGEVREGRAARDNDGVVSGDLEIGVERSAALGEVGFEERFEVHGILRKNREILRSF